MLRPWQEVPWIEPPLHVSHKLLTYPIQRTSPIFSSNHAAILNAGSHKQVTAWLATSTAGWLICISWGYKRT